ncbi:ABC transporter substrate-binding protein [Marinomonas ushuaiensis]|uniref:ABC transporter substrate-binding protein n=1 Tax=Marinomonas ushuaiensis TaxID=263818 RepID=UPI00146FB83F|nr:sugar ABC transporter substrate-binding protein [Marinomonas ushuaiensis]
MAGLLSDAAATTDGITVTSEQLPFGQLFSAIEVRLQARNENPDLFFVDGPMTASYTMRGHLTALDDILPDASEIYTSAALQQGMVAGKLMSVPIESSTVVMLVNNSLFEAAGIEAPTNDPADRWTWEEVLAAGKTISELDESTWGFNFHYSDSPYMALVMPQSNGATLIGEDGVTATGYVDSPKFVEAMSTYAELYNTGIAPAGMYDYSLALELFLNGKVGMFAGVVSDAIAAEGRDGLDFTVAPMPYFEGGTPVTPTGSWHVGINPRTEHPEEAAKLVQALASPEFISAYFDKRANPPVLTEAWDSMSEKLDTPLWTLARYEIQNTAMARPSIGGWLEYDSILRNALREIQSGSDVAERLSAAAVEMNRELKKYAK